MSPPGGLRVESEPHERFPDVNCAVRRLHSGLPGPVPVLTGSDVTRFGSPLRRLPCQTAGTEMGCRTTSGDMRAAGGASKSWSFMIHVTALRMPVQVGSCSPSCRSFAPLCLLALDGLPSWRRRGCIRRETRCPRLGCMWCLAREPELLFSTRCSSRVKSHLDSRQKLRWKPRSRPHLSS